MPSLIKIPVGIGSKYRLDLRSTGSVVLVDLADAEYQTPTILAGSPAGCIVLADALMEMASEMRVQNEGTIK